VVIANFRFYAVLNNFLAPWLRQRSFDQRCAQDATVKHMIEALGVPHTEVELILVDGAPVDFSHRPQHGERISVYPGFGEFEIAGLAAHALLRPPLPARPRFIADAHLGQLAKQLRMLGFDVLYRNDYSDAAVARIAADEGRVVLTRDRDLLIRKEIVHGCYLHAINGDEQVMEVLGRLRLSGEVRAFSRCLTCNGELRAVEPDAVADRVPPLSHQHYDRFFECAGCAQVYWEGSHVERMRTHMARMLGSKGE
jgi:uncharacterized protein with PIN domain